MKVVLYSLILNNHQANIADELWRLTNHQFCFVELATLQAEHRKGDTRNYDNCPYLLRAWESSQAYAHAMNLAREAECCIFSGILALPFQKERLKLGRLSFDMSERWLKRGLLNLFSPSIFKMFLAYYCNRWYKKPLYKLCCSAFAAEDQYRLGTFKDRCYKWGYFTKVDDIKIRDYTSNMESERVTSLMWCSRFLKLKHPELPIMMAARLKGLGYRFILDMYGCGEYEDRAKELVAALHLDDIVRFNGAKPNVKILEDMRSHDIFLFTSDKNEGWGAVSNESMSNGCVLVVSDEIGSAPYLIKPGVTGLSFRAPKYSSSFDCPDKIALDSLCAQVRYLLDNPSKIQDISSQGMKIIQEYWSPVVAAQRLLKLIDCIEGGVEPGFDYGPCSKA